MRRLGLLMFTVLLVFGSTADATRIWVSGNTGNWSDTANWSGGVLPTAETAQIDAGYVTVNSVQSTQQLLMGVVGGGTAVLDISSNLTSSKGSAELFALVKASNAATSVTVNHSAGTVSVFQPGYTGLGETRLVSASTTLGTAIYNLSGTAVLDTEVLSKGNKTSANAQFNATGGTLVLRNMIYRFGTIVENGVGFNQGQAKLEIGAFNTVAALSVGNATNSMDYTVTAGTLNFDIASATSFDKVTQYGTLANTFGATLGIDLLGGYVPLPGSFFDVWTFTDLSKAGSGAFSSVTSGWTAGWVDTNGDLTTDTLRLTYIPEPATIALLGLGLLAIRRNKK